MRRRKKTVSLLWGAGGSTSNVNGYTGAMLTKRFSSAGHLGIAARASPALLRMRDLYARVHTFVKKLAVEAPEQAKRAQAKQPISRAMMCFWISLVPSAMVRARASR